MNHNQATQLGDYLRAQRELRSISVRTLATKLGVDHAQVVRLEQGAVASPKPEMLRGIAEALELPIADVLTLAGYPLIDELPSLQPYLRTKYHELPEQALQELERSFTDITQRYRGRGPRNGEDEQEGDQ